MKALTVFVKKEFLESVRTGKLLLLVILFLLFGIMNPAAAKLTPWLLKTMSESMEQTGLLVTAVEVDALSSWTQFYKNLPMAMIAFLLIFGGILSGEYQRGTLVHMVTKGLSRWKLLAAKALALLLIWSGAYWLMYLVTYAYTAYFWDNSLILHCGTAAFCAYITGLWMISLLLLGSVLFCSMGGALGLTAAAAAVSYLCGILPAVSKYTPTSLLSPLALLTGGTDVSGLLITVFVTLAFAAANMAVAAVCIKKKAI